MDGEKDGVRERRGGGGGGYGAGEEGTSKSSNVFAIGQFSEAGLHEFVIFRARSRQRSQRHFRADF